MEKITKEQGESLNIQADILQQLQAVAPSVFADGKVDVERLKQLIGESAIAQGERYALSWAGKSETLDVLRKPTMGTLVPAPEESVNFDQTGHVFIEGENLEVLKILQKNYYGRVKMIYIDPPYNTGNDSFIYPDRFEESRADYLRRVNDIDDKDGTLTKAGLYRKNSKENGQFHSNWLNMMYPRLFLARNLLRNDGVIFVSIDDNEVANLRLLMDEVFGEENFVGQIIINSTPNARDYGHIGKMHDFLLMYCKNIDFLVTNELQEVTKEFKYYDDKGGFNIHPLYNSNEQFSSLNRPNLYYPFYLNPNKKISNGFFEISLNKTTDSIEIFPPKSEKNNIQFVWRWGKPKALENINVEITGYRTSTGEYRIVQKMRHDSKIIRSLQLDSSFSNRRGTSDLEQIFEKKVFSFPKPVALIKTLLKVGVDKSNDIILDFFSGSGTTAQAVLELNAEDGGNRKFVCVQLPILNGDAPNAQAAGFDHIADIAKERIRRVIKKLEAEQNGALGFEKKTDLGMRVFKLSPSNFKIWRGDLMENEDELAEQMEMFIDSLKDGAKEDHIAWELAIKSLDPMQLDVRMEKVEIGGVPVYNFENGRLFIVLHAIDQTAINAILAAPPRALLVLDSLFGKQADMITNLALDCERLNIQFQLV